jgi:hypothetical protein
MDRSWDTESEGESSDPHPRPVSLDRRHFLIAVGGAAAYTALRPHLLWARRLRRPPAAGAGTQPRQAWSLPADPPPPGVELARALVAAAVLAPSHWNTQPWRMEVDVQQIRLVRDPQRALPVTDPDQRCLTLSLGAALENMLVCMRAYGLRPTVQYFPHGSAGPVAAVAWSAGEQRRDRELFAAITERRTNRREYDGRGIYLQNRAALLAQIPESLRVHWLDDHRRMRSIADLVHDATRAQVRDRRAQAERMAWMRFGEDEARRRGDGITLEDLELGGLPRWFAGNYFDPKSWFLRFGASSAARQARSAVRSAGALALLTAPRHEETLWLGAGQAYERFALKATQLGIAHQPLDAPIAVESTRAELRRSFGLNGEQPLMLVRLGHAKRPPASARRAVSLVASFRNS